MSSPDTDLILRPSKGKWLLVLLISLTFSVGGIAMIATDEPRGWLVAGFFGLGVLVSLLQFLPNFFYLRISAFGLEVRVGFRFRSYRWEDIDFFWVGSGPRVHGIRHRFVGFNYSSNFHGKDLSRSLARKMGVPEVALPDTYGMKPDDLAEFLNQCKARAAGVDVDSTDGAPGAPASS